MERTFFLVKPDAVAAGHVDKIVAYLKNYGFGIVSQKQKTLTRKDVMFLCPMHVNMDFFDDLVAFLCSGSSELFILERERATLFLDELVGKTDPNQSAENSLRRRFGTTIRKNAVHSPSSRENAIRELAYFFSEANWD